MHEQTIRETAVQKVMQLSEEEVLKLLIYITGMEDGIKLAQEQQHQPND